ncbi:unnamed protein product, partial [Rotaria sp. Silwood2]
ASLSIIENAGPNICADLKTISNKLVLKDNSFEYLDDGNVDISAHAIFSLLAS